ncbi:hypothetical protein FB567DRAFT_548534 [Paraphoma chrysanthemicola]|uniref:F-box domain-containing protein n=1 Tax=Paraphoma chrysanthemicola TaxID=798071 RepID=A0A8K0VZM5_9PLEO|nr:hypothetical protein FB567DRAFT_548534 [Paraphoma chrysanthemicola]
MQGVREVMLLLFLPSPRSVCYLALASRNRDRAFLAITSTIAGTSLPALNEYTNRATYDKMDLESGQDATAHHTGDELSSAFLELLHDLNPLVDELLIQPEFHRILDLPTELRLDVYEQYFLDNTQSVTCRTWPALRVSWALLKATDRKKTIPSFLPNLCLVSKALQEELLSCLLMPIDFHLDDIYTLSYGLKRVAYKIKILQMAAKIRKVTICNINDQKDQTIVGAQDLLSNSASLKSELHNWWLSDKLPILTNLRELAIAFHAPLFSRGTQSGSGGNRALSIDDYLVGFDTQSVLSLAGLQQITITGTSGTGSCRKKSSYNTEVIEHDENIGCLRAILNLGRQIKDGFVQQGRQVEATVRLVYGKEMKEETAIM